MADTTEQPTEQPVVANDAPVEQPAKVDDAQPTDAAQPTDDDINSKKVTLADLSAKGTALYAKKSYEEAVDIFSEASVLQAEINGEMAPQNAEILFHYGRSLFKVGQSKSDVLGATAGADKAGNAAPKKSKPAPAPKPVETEADKAAEDPSVKKPLFQFTGDENFDESDDDEVGTCLFVADRYRPVKLTNRCRSRPKESKKRKRTISPPPSRFLTLRACAISSCSSSQMPSLRMTRARAWPKAIRPLSDISRNA
jgi:hypothetical protein